MTDDKIALRALLEKGSDTTFLREMIAFAAERVMELETDTRGRNSNAGCVKSAGR
jgi:putative transposase